MRCNPRSALRKPFFEVDAKSHDAEWQVACGHLLAQYVQHSLLGRLRFVGQNTVNGNHN